MVTLFGLLNIGGRGIQGAQAGLNTTGQNIANADTEGYSRQRVMLTSNYPLEVTPGSVGTGVRVVGFQRFRDSFIEGQVRAQLSMRGFLSRQEEGFNSLQVLLNDPLNAVATSLDSSAEAGLNFVLKQYFSAFQELAGTPESIAVRSSVVQTAVTLTDTFNTIRREVDRLQTDVNQRITLMVDEINSITSQIADINLRIGRVEADPRNNANDLRDQRDLLMRRLSELVPVQSFEDRQGQVLISILGVAVVNSGSSTDLISRTVAGGTQLSDIFFDLPGSRVLTGDFTRGELGGLLDMRDRVIPNVVRELDTLARGIIDGVNRIHSRGTGLRAFSTTTGLNRVSNANTALNQSGLDFPVNNGLLTIRIEDADGVVQRMLEIEVTQNDTLNSLAAKINAANPAGTNYVDAIIDTQNRLQLNAEEGYRFAFHDDTSGVLSALGLNTLFTGSHAGDMAVRTDIQNDLTLLAASRSGAPGDNANALAIAQLENGHTMAGGTTTYGDYYRSTLAQLGVEARRVMQNHGSTNLLVKALDNAQEAVSGVSLDEEAINLIRFQQSFAASARFLTSTDELIDLIVNRLGMVGR